MRPVAHSGRKQLADRLPDFCDQYARVREAAGLPIGSA